MNILMVNLPFAGHTNPTLPLAASLARRGHRVSYVNAEAFRDRIEATGARFVPYQNYPAEPTERQQTRLCFRAAYDTALSLPEQFDLLLYEMFFYPGKRLADLLGIPCVRQFAQPAWSGQTYADATLRYRLSSLRIKRQVMSRQSAAHMGLERSSLVKALLHDKPDLNIVYVPQFFQHRREDFGGDYLFTVPLPEADRQAPHVEIPYHAMRRPVAYISLGSIISNRGFCRECIRAFGGKPLSVILNTGRIVPESLGRIPDNIFAYSFVPQLEVLRHADVFLTHCGMNSLNEAMAAGVPMVAMPFMNDQIPNAISLMRLGIARRVRSFPSRGKELYQAVMAVAQDERIRQRSKEVQGLLNAEMNMDAVVDRVEGLVSAQA